MLCAWNLINKCLVTLIKHYIHRVTQLQFSWYIEKERNIILIKITECVSQSLAISLQKVVEFVCHCK